MVCLNETSFLPTKLSSRTSVAAMNQNVVLKMLLSLLHSPKSAHHLSKAQIILWLKHGATSEQGLTEFLLEATR